MLQAPHATSNSPLLARMDEIVKLLRSANTPNRKALITELITKGLSFPGLLAQCIELLWPYIQHELTLTDLLFQKHDNPEKGINLLWCLAWYSELQPDVFLKMFERFQWSLEVKDFMISIESDFLKGKTAFWCLANAYKLGKIQPMYKFEERFKNKIRNHHLMTRAESPNSDADILWLLANGLFDITMFLTFWKKHHRSIPFQHFLVEVKHEGVHSSILSSAKPTEIVFKKVWEYFREKVTLEDFFVQEVSGLNKKQAALWKLAQSVYQGHMSYECFTVFWNKISNEITLEDLVARPNLENPHYVSLLWYLSVFASKNHPEFLYEVLQRFNTKIHLEHINPKCFGTSPLYYIFLSLTKNRNVPLFKIIWQRFKSELTIEDFIPSPNHAQFGHDCLFSILLLQNTPFANEFLKTILKQVPGDIPQSYLEESLPFYLETSESDIGRKLRDVETARSLLEKKKLLELVEARKEGLKTVNELGPVKAKEQQDVNSLIQKLDALQKENHALREKVKTLEASASLAGMQTRLPSVSEMLKGTVSFTQLSRQNQGLPQVTSMTNINTNPKRQKLT